MALEGLKYPTVRFDTAGSYVTWEQINGVINVDDEFGTIVSDTYKIVMKNSVGVSQTLSIKSTATGIPISVNNLRANESYVFDVYATLNLNDGNANVDLVYIGSCTVQTKKPNALRANYELLPAYNTPFSFYMSLINPNGVDSSLEASTLSEITVSIYQGEAITADKQIYRRVVDTNDEYYESTIADMMYNKNCLVNPEFFNSRNSDFYDTKYTLVLSDAHDYTRYKNEIPIENAIYSFDINSYIPDLPEDRDNAITVVSVYNRSAASYGGTFNEELDINTLVGYSIRADFDNTTGTAKYVEYTVHMYNEATKQYEVVESLGETVHYNDDGSLPYYTFWLDNGTMTYDKNTLNRGDSFKFSYKVFLDITNDDVLVEYPAILEKNSVLYSKTLMPNKQYPRFTAYPYIVDGGSAEWKYKVTDIDYALSTNKLYGYVNSKVINNADIIVGDENFNSVKLNGFALNSKYDISYSSKVNVTLPVSNRIIASGYTYPKNEISSLKYSIVSQDNGFLVQIEDQFNSNVMSLLDSIVYADITVKPKKSADYDKLGETVFEHKSFASGDIYISNYDLSKYSGVDLEVKLDVYYDTNVHGFGLDNYVALQNYDIEGLKNYYKKNGANYVVSSSISDSFFEYEFDDVTPELKLNGNVLPIIVDNSGVIYKSNNIVLKELKRVSVQTSGNDYKFDKIIPGISLMNKNKLSITALLDRASVTAKLKILDDMKIKDDKIIVELSTTDENGLNAVFVRNIEKTVAELKNAFIIEDLLPSTHYEIRFYCYLFDESSGTYNKSFLYDYDYDVLGRKYKFSSLEKVEMSDFNFSLTATSYSSKMLNITYDLDTLFGYDHIKYELYKKVGTEYVKVNSYIPSSYHFISSMRVSVSATPGENNEINYGDSYKFVATPIALYDDGNGEVLQVDLGRKEVNFVLDKYTLPIVGISKGESDTSLYFRVSVSDVSHVIYKDEYSVSLIDLSDKNKVIATLSGISTSILNKRFDFDKAKYGLISGHKYKLEVHYKVDTQGTGKNLTNYVRSKESEYGKNIDLGVITSYNSSSETADSFTLVYSDSYNLQIINNVYVTLINYDLGFYESVEIPFSVSYDPGKNQYVWKYNVDNGKLVEGNIYLVTVNYYDNSGNLLDQSESSIYY